MEKPAKEIQFKFVKSNDFKTIRADGVWGGFTVSGRLNINFFLDTIELPKVVTHKIIQNKMSIIPVEEKRESVVMIREIPFGVNLDLATAKGMVEWIKTKIEEYEANQTKMKGGDNGSR